MTEPRTHDEFCFNTDLYQDDVEDYMCICNRLDDARRQERTDQQELTKAAVAEAEQRVRDEIAADGPWFRSVVHQCCEDKHTAYAAGVQAARDAVAGLRPIYYHGKRVGDCVKRDDALAAIDGDSGKEAVG